MKNTTAFSGLIGLALLAFTAVAANAKESAEIKDIPDGYSYSSEIIDRNGEKLAVFKNRSGNQIVVGCEKVIENFYTGGHPVEDIYKRLTLATHDCMRGSAP